MKHIILIILAMILLACGTDNTLGGEDHGNLATSDEGITLTQDEHPIGWGEADCFFCHNMENIHQTDRTGTGLNLEGIRELTQDEGLASCATCHGTNGL